MEPAEKSLKNSLEITRGKNDCFLICDFGALSPESFARSLDFLKRQSWTPDISAVLGFDLSRVDDNIVRCPDAAKAAEMEALIREVRAQGDSVGGVVTCVAQGVPAGWGEPIFDRLEARLAAACLGIPAAKGFEIGSGFSGSTMRGSQHNDLFTEGGRTLTNRSGGVQGGISNGMDIVFRVAFKPVATILKAQPTIDIHGQPTVVEGRGRHDPCVVPRAVVVVEAMTALTLADFYLLDRMSRR